jgi:hypothetical protein
MALLVTMLITAPMIVVTGAAAIHAKSVGRRRGRGSKLI